MANYLYNGIELPDINEVWTDELKAQYPYAIINRSEDYLEDYGSTMLISIFTEPPYATTSTINLKPAYGIDYYLDGEGSWQFYEAFEGITIRLPQSAYVWSSYDITNKDGDTVIFPYSEPIPVESEPMPEFMLYNGVKLPNIDKVWTDKETYPHAFIKYLPSYSVYTVYLCKTQVLYNRREDTLVGTDGNIYYTAYDVNEENDGFVLYKQDASSGGVNASGVIWTSHDIVYKNDNASVYFAGSDPVPVGGGETDGGNVSTGKRYLLERIFPPIIARALIEK